MRGKYSPTVAGWYARDQEWWRKNFTTSEFNLYDKDGYDSYGYDANDRDRAGVHENDYATDGELFENVWMNWYHATTPSAC